MLDYDDTYAPGLAHLSAPTAPAALAVAADLGRSAGDALDAYARGFEAMGALARASHPALYDRGWHPTAVCGAVGAAVAAAKLAELDEAATASAEALALLRAGGLRAAFGSHGKALQVGMAAAAGVEAARLAAAGACAPARVKDAFDGAYGGRWASADPNQPAVDENWIKAYPCCLQTHSAIEAADQVRAAGGAPDGAAIELRVHPVSLQAAAIGIPHDGLEAKFSLPYTAAYALLHGLPTVASFEELDPEAGRLAGRVAVVADDTLAESEAVLSVAGRDVARVRAARGSPARPLTAEEHARKVHDLTGARLDGALDDPSRPAAELLDLLGPGRD